MKNKRDTRIHNQVQYIRLFLASLPQTDDILSVRKQSLPNDQVMQEGPKLVRSEVFVICTSSIYLAFSTEGDVAGIK